MSGGAILALFAAALVLWALTLATIWQAFRSAFHTVFRNDDILRPISQQHGHILAKLRRGFVRVFHERDDTVDLLNLISANAERIGP